MPTITPLDILRRTPKSNCGSCGFSTCLAFAAAVARGGESTQRCPHLDRAGLVLPEIRSKDFEKLSEQVMAEQDQLLVATLKQKIAAVDLAFLAPRLGGEWLPETGQLHLRYLDRIVLISHQKICFVESGQVLDHRDQILLYNYISSGGGRLPKEDWVGMESLPNSISKIKTLAVYSEQRIARLLSGLPSDFLFKMGKQLNALSASAELAGSATAGLIIPVLPMLPQFVLFWEEEPEDGFEAKVKILFDRHVLDFLDLESLVFSAERLAERMTELAALQP